MRSLTRAEVAASLLEGNDYLILTHRRPDGDTLGSAAALCLGLRQLGKTAHILENPQTTEKFLPMLEGLTCRDVAENASILCVDVAAEGMLPDNAKDLDIRLRIDHHATGGAFTPCSLVDGKAAACGELIYDILTEMGVTLDTPIANALYTAISTDTGCFRFANTTAHTFFVAGECAKVSPDLYSLNNLHFSTVSLARLRLQGYMLENAQFLQDNKVCICPIPLEIEDKLGITEDDMDNISGFPRTIAGVKIAATLRQERDTGKIKLSLRAAPGYDAGAICALLGGGGHPGAAGASLNCSMEEAVQRLIAVLPAICDN